VTASFIHGIGTDIVKVARIQTTLERFGERFVGRLLTNFELSEYQCSRHPERFVAKRFAAKEAAVKALGLGFREGLTFNSIGVTHDQYGKPELIYLGPARAYSKKVGITQSFLSLSDELDYAVAFVVLLGRDMT
jgi:holo-[acyl-carrier protein] synthase